MEHSDVDIHLSNFLWRCATSPLNLGPGFKRECMLNFCSSIDHAVPLKSRQFYCKGCYSVVDSSSSVEYKKVKRKSRAKQHKAKHALCLFCSFCGFPIDIDEVPKMYRSKPFVSGQAKSLPASTSKSKTFTPAHGTGSTSVTPKTKAPQSQSASKSRRLSKLQKLLAELWRLFFFYGVVNVFWKRRLYAKLVNKFQKEIQEESRVTWKVVACRMCVGAKPFLLLPAETAVAFLSEIV